MKFGNGTWWLFGFYFTNAERNYIESMWSKKLNSSYSFFRRLRNTVRAVHWALDPDGIGLQWFPRRFFQVGGGDVVFKDGLWRQE